MAEQVLHEAGGQYLTFISGDELFAVAIPVVSEIIEMDDITRVPRAPSFIRGVINLRGGVVPVIDLVAKLSDGRSEISKRSCVVLVCVQHEEREQMLGLLVDEVREIVDIGPEAIKPPPQLGDKADTGFIEAMAQVNEHFIILLEVANVLEQHEIRQVGEIARQGTASTPDNQPPALP